MCPRYQNEVTTGGPGGEKDKVNIERVSLVGGLEDLPRSHTQEDKRLISLMMHYDLFMIYIFCIC